MSPQQQQIVQAQVRALDAQQQAQIQAQGQPGTPASRQIQTGQQPAIQIQTHNLPSQPATQPLVAAVQFANGTSGSPPPQQAVSSTSGTPVSINGSASGSTNGGTVVQRPASVQNQEATATPSPLDPDTAAVITSIGAQPVASYYNALKTLQSMFEVNDGVTINPNGSAQTRFQVTPQVSGAWYLFLTSMN